MVDFSNIREGDFVEITLLVNRNKQSTGKVMLVLSSDPSETIVVLENGSKGKVIRIINSADIIKERIMTETQHTENKENLIENVMRQKVLPQTVQSFLNSDGGYLHIGIKDTGTLKERLVGLGPDFQKISGDESLTNDKLCDKFAREIMDCLWKYLVSDVPIGDLVELNFVHVDDVQILEIEIKKSQKPWFYRHLANSGKAKQFECTSQDGTKIRRHLDDFYIRDGAKKKLLETHKEVYDYIKEHFINK